MLKLKREGGVYVITTKTGEVIKVLRSRYAFKLAERLSRAQGLKVRAI